MPQYIVSEQIATLLSRVRSAASDASLPPSGIVTRFAPSPNGPLHIGHAYAAICAHDFAHVAQGRFLLRIEDIDGSRSRQEHINAIIQDMKWLSLDWDGDVIFQSQRVPEYHAALKKLQDMGLVYRCICTRSEIAAAIKKRPVPHGPDGPVYPGTCRGKDLDGSAPYCWRLDMKKAAARTGALIWYDLEAGKQRADPALFGDIVIWRKDAPASYHLAATLDDAADGVTHVVRGKDIFAYTAVHILLQNLLGLLQPGYWHHGLLVGKDGEKLAKSKGSEPLFMLRSSGLHGHKLSDDIRNGKLPLGISLSNS